MDADNEQEFEKEFESLTDRVVQVVSDIYEAQKILSELENESCNLLRKLLRRNGKDQG